VIHPTNRKYDMSAAAAVTHHGLYNKHNTTDSSKTWPDNNTQLATLQQLVK
jgi:hypothetical protein